MRGGSVSSVSLGGAFVQLDGRAELAYKPLRSAERLGTGGNKGMAERKGVFREFRDFISRGSVVDLAVAVVIGAAFTKIVTSLVEGILMPPIGLLTGRIDFASMFVVLDKSKGVPASLADAKVKGIPVVAYGQFINDVISFIVVAFVVFLIVKRVNRIRSGEPADKKAPTTKDCPYCVSAIPLKATRCPECTSQLQPA